ncbi:UNVERIFIED_CONTAM: hypothetical protein GTU68_066840 [Idotea baltica]|nr:hypothetical protein [Idotea baltica]
MLIIKTLISF